MKDSLLSSHIHAQHISDRTNRIALPRFLTKRLHDPCRQVGELGCVVVFVVLGRVDDSGPNVTLIPAALAKGRGRGRGRAGMSGMSSQSMILYCIV